MRTELVLYNYKIFENSVLPGESISLCVPVVESLVAAAEPSKLL